MNNIIPAICAIEQEMKYMGNSEEGSRQFRKGYLRALKIVREFLNFQKPDSVLLRTPSCSAVARLLSALSQEQGVVHTRPAVISIDEKVSPELSVPNPLEAKALEIALGVTS